MKAAYNLRFTIYYIMEMSNFGFIRMDLKLGQRDKVSIVNK